MRRELRLALIVVMLGASLAALNPTSLYGQDATTAPVFSQDQATSVTQRFINAFNRHDADAIAALFAPDGVFFDTPNLKAGIFTGPTQIKNYFDQQLFQGYPDAHWDATIAVNNNQVSIFWILDQRNTGVVGNQPPTNCPIHLPGTDVLQLGANDQGQPVILLDASVYDWRSFNRQLKAC